jgi:hypothetical protein
MSMTFENPLAFVFQNQEADQKSHRKRGMRLNVRTSYSVAA